MKIKVLPKTRFTSVSDSAPTTVGLSCIIYIRHPLILFKSLFCHDLYVTMHHQRKFRLSPQCLHRIAITCVYCKLVFEEVAKLIQHTMA